MSSELSPPSYAQRPSPSHQPMTEVQSPPCISQDLEKGPETDVPSNEDSNAESSGIKKAATPPQLRSIESARGIAFLLVLIQFIAWVIIILVGGDDEHFFKQNLLGRFTVLMVPTTVSQLISSGVRSHLQGSPYLDVALALCPLLSATITLEYFILGAVRR